MRCSLEFIFDILPAPLPRMSFSLSPVLRRTPLPLRVFQETHSFKRYCVSVKSTEDRVNELLFFEQASNAATLKPGIRDEHRLRAAKKLNGDHPYHRTKEVKCGVGSKRWRRALIAPVKAWLNARESPIDAEHGQAQVRCLRTDEKQFSVNRASARRKQTSISL